MIIGLTGGIGSGKSTVAQFFKELGAFVIDADETNHQLLGQESIKKQIVEHFGPSLLQKDGTLNRARLRTLIFESPQERIFLESLLHPLIKAKIQEKAAKAPPDTYTIVDIPLLIEANFQNQVNRIVVVDCPERLQIERISKRDGIPKESIQAIINTQASRSSRLSIANDVIENDSTREALKEKVRALHLYFIKLPH
jgi:dephospho-CoA kinase